MTKFSIIPLSRAGRPILLENEVEIRSESCVSIVNQEKLKVKGEIFGAGLIILTNFRLISIQESGSPSANLTGWGMYLSCIKSIEDCAKLFSVSTRIQINFSEKGSEIGLRFNKEGKSEFLEIFHKVLEKKSWEKGIVSDKQPELPLPEPVFSSSNAGVSGIIRRQERTMQSVDTLAKSALSDLDALMLRAREAIAVVQRYASYTDENHNNNDAMSETTSQAAEKNEMETIMQNIGIISPVTKFSAGRMYHAQLARQMADLLLQQGRLARLGGMITLTDLYCLFNRARGTELVSPDDLLKAATLTGSLSLGVKLRVFPSSGVKVLQDVLYSEEEWGKKIVKLITEDKEYNATGIQACDVAQRLGISLIVAKEQLLIAESSLFLCRDDSPQGLFFYHNSIMSL